MIMWEILRYPVIAVIGYLLGNVSVGILISKAFGIEDIRKHGSGNAGSTNVLRTLGWVPSVLTLIGDCLKAFLAAKIGSRLAGDPGLIIGGLCAVIGHIYPVFFGFKGGKGIASCLGYLLSFSPPLGLILLVCVIVITALTGYVSVGSITACVLAPFLVIVLTHSMPGYLCYLIGTIIAAILAIFCHRKNIVRLIHHEENRLDFEKISRIRSKLKQKKE